MTPRSRVDRPSRFLRMPRRPVSCSPAAARRGWARAKAALEWHGSTLLRRTVGDPRRARSTGRSSWCGRRARSCPTLPAGVEVVDDPREGQGPCRAWPPGWPRWPAAPTSPSSAPPTCRSCTPPSSARVLRRRCTDGTVDVALPVARGYRQPLAAALPHRARAAGRRALVEADRLRPAFLFEQCRGAPASTTPRCWPTRRWPRSTPSWTRCVNVNEPADYRAARGPAGARGDRPALRRARAARGAPRPAHGPRGHRRRGRGRGRAHARPARPRGAQRRPDHPRRRSCPLAAGDTVVFLSADAGG